MADGADSAALAEEKQRLMLVTEALRSSREELAKIRERKLARDAEQAELRAQAERELREHAESAVG
jgi:hypothetical protein